MFAKKVVTRFMRAFKNKYYTETKRTLYKPMVYNSMVSTYKYGYNNYHKILNHSFVSIVYL